MEYYFVMPVGKSTATCKGQYKLNNGADNYLYQTKRANCQPVISASTLFGEIEKVDIT